MRLPRMAFLFYATDGHRFSRVREIRDDPRNTRNDAKKMSDKPNGNNADGATTSVSSHSSVGEAASFPSAENRDANNGAAVAGGGDPGRQNNGQDTRVDAPGYNLPNSKKVYVAGELHPDIRVPFREISLAPTKSLNGQIEVNEAVRVYDTSGPWGDPSVTLDSAQGLPPLRDKWIRDRGDVQEIEGRVVRPNDDGWLSDSHAAHASGKRSTLNGRSGNGGSDSTSNLSPQPSNFAQRKPLRAKSHAVTQLYYARQGVITPEMAYIAIRENLGRE